MRESEAITVWCDETSVDILGSKHHVIGMLVTNSDKEELGFLGELIEARKKHRAWTTMHANTLESNDESLMKLAEEWVDVFKKNDHAYFHIFAYKENRGYMQNGYEKYFAKQSAFGLGWKLKKEGYRINTMFSKVGTITFLFDKRRDGTGQISSDYEIEIREQLRKLSKRGSDLTARFSFVDSSCFNAIQLSDLLLYMVNLRILKENSISLTERQQKILNIWERHFIDGNMRKLQDYAYYEKFNYFLSDQ